MELEGKRIAILAEDMYQELELWYPLLRMREAGAEAVVVGKPPPTRSRPANSTPSSYRAVSRLTGCAAISRCLTW